MKCDEILARAVRREALSEDQALALWERVPIQELAFAADRVRRAEVPDPKVVTWQIDRNVNITNVCVSGCRFCNFHCRPADQERAWVVTIDELVPRIEETLALGGDQLLLQGGLHPRLGIDFYTELFREIKRRYPTLRLNALGAPEVAHIARISGLGIPETLRRLVDAGLDTLPGAGAEILVDEVRSRISPAKPTADQWLEVMRQAHRMDIPTTATMMYGHVETPRHIVQHLIKLRDLQAARPPGSRGFTAFIPWVFRSEGTQLGKELAEAGINSPSAFRPPLEYLRVIAISRLVLVGIRNIQASWLTLGAPTAQIALHGGANDMGSIMIEERVVSAAGARDFFDAQGIRRAIREAGFRPVLRDQLYRPREVVGGEI